MIKVLFAYHGKIDADDNRPSYASLYHGLPPNMIYNSTAPTIRSAAVFVRSTN